jgi:hypothetical protein
VNIAKDRASVHGPGMQYAGSVSGEEETNWSNEGPKERGWGKWLILPGRPLKKFQKGA